MQKYQGTKIFICFIFWLIPLAAVCQLSTPKWVKDLGAPGSDSSIPTATKTDAQNNIYIAGTFSGSVNFDPSPTGVKILTAIGNFDTYIAKYTSAGDLIWAVSFGGTGLDQINGMTLDASGNVTVIGQTNSPVMDADPGPGVYNISNMGDSDAFIVSLDLNGNFRWAQQIGSTGTDYGDRIGSDAAGNVVAVCQYQSKVNIGANTYTAQGTFAGLILKYDQGGNLLWNISIGSAGDDETRAITIDHHDNILVTGIFGDKVNFNPLGTANTVDGGGGSGFLAKYTPAGILTWVQPIAGAITNANLNICVDADNNAYVNGPFTGKLTFGTTALNRSGAQDLFVAKYAGNGTFQWVKDIGGTGSSSIYNYGIAVSQDNFLYFSGYFNGTIDFNPSPTAKATVSDHGQRDLFLAKFDTDGNYKWAFSAGNPNCNNTLGRWVDIDGNNDVILVGSFCSTVNFDASGCTTYNLTAQSTARDSFMAKYAQAKPSALGEITAFDIAQQSEPTVIDQNTLNITVTVPQGTDVTALIPNITVNSAVAISPKNETAQDFTNPVTYTLSTGCSTLNYLVTVVFSTAATQTICPNNPAALTGTAELPVPDSYLWQIFNPAGNTWSAATGVNNAKDYITSKLSNTSGINLVYNYRRQISTNGNITFDSFNKIIVYSEVAGNTITTLASTTLCSGGDPALISGSTPSGGDGNFAYQWQSSIDGITYTDIAGANQISYDPPPVAVTTWFQRNVTAICNTVLASNAIKITLLNLKPTVTTNLSICEGVSTALMASGGTTYSWTPTTGLSDPMVPNPVASPLVTTTYTVAVGNGVCTSTAAVTVTVIPKPMLDAGQNITIYQGQSVRLGASAKGDHLIYSWTPGTYLNDLSTPNPLATPPKNITYTVTVQSENGCFIESGDVAVRVLQNLVIPNTFTPNGDGTNDTWDIIGLNTYTDCDVNIFNRNGALVFKSTGYAKNWDARYKGKNIPAGTYYYVINLKDGRKPLAGWVAVVR